ncbi:hypothetical protein VUJ49_16725 [Pseudomonas berkeleyensis]|uniref:Uncharacterized protein n=1 Tax=Pseudomonas berkeleyensis TaxID=2726956 RepID=A0A7G5DIT2_9PSED|nr:hypothetical protein [Pseudomonas berkeleyensis]QMV61657.1 hypothetical protein HS968_16650 [Pseudomonas berkeleyensis]WSO37089.1 hypothetical protein VUJ49_16725 [Pseudomonas berkeleyensis]
MTSDKRVIHLHRRDPQEALTRLNRITGLRFARWPESLLDHVAPENVPQPADETAQPPSPCPGVSSG